MVMKGYSTLPITPELQPRHQMQFSVRPNSHEEVKKSETLNKGVTLLIYFCLKQNDKILSKFLQFHQIAGCIPFLQNDFVFF